MKAKPNIWSIEKDNSIKVFLLLLNQEVSDQSFFISDNCNLDPRSVRLHKVDEFMVSAYIYTYGQLEGKYGIHLEFPTFDESDISSSLDIYENISFEALVELLRVHFDLV